MDLIFALLATLVTFAVLLRCAFRRLSQRRAAKERGDKAEAQEIDLLSIKPLPADFNWRTQQLTPYLPWNNGPYHVKMGMHQNTTLENWIELDGTYLDKYDLKKKLSIANHDEVLSILPGCD
ncbi:hypothetical protein BDV06DRAFT_222797 [Aspergillus oleicola]